MKKQTESIIESYDYIIVGAGSSGCSLTSEISMRTKSSVCLIEAGGGNKHPFISMPRGYVALWTKPKYYWSFPIKNKLGTLSGEQWYYGKGLGGSSAVNGTWYFRGQPSDYDAWLDFGKKEWGWEKMRDVFNKMERYVEKGSHTSRGKDGPVEITTVKFNSRIIDAIIEAGKGIGLNGNQDVNTPYENLIGPTQMTVGSNGKRVSAYNAFIEPLLKEKNRLSIQTETFVEKIVFEGKKAVGVRGVKNGKPFYYKANKSVILSAGVLQSPKILQLSGVGDPVLLEKLGIELVHSQKNVGKNLSEHMMGEIRFRLKNDHGTNRDFRGWRLVKNTMRYYLSRTGAMSYGLPEVSAMLATRPEYEKWPNIQLGFLLATFEVPEEGKKSAPGRGKTELEPGMSIAGFVLRPKSRGTVEITSPLAKDPVAVNPNWFSDKEDELEYLELFKTIRRIASQAPLKDFIAAELSPTCNAETTEDLKKMLPNLLRPGLHGTGTCRMGTAENGVVDGRLKVHGLENLRIVDCSVMPTPISGNTNGPAMALGMRAADIIIEDCE